ncbi:hypothetical protein AB0K04_11255 [Micromonospora coxensis]|uniref:hypothetical protein n=1 Tax=Micromonospora coxensis TaxID=356852 RepID=UPI00342F9CC4
MSFPSYAGRHQGPLRDDLRDGDTRRWPLWRWVAANTVLLALGCAVGGSGFISPQDGSTVVGYLAAVCILGSCRALSAPVEWFLARQYAYRSILFSHVTGFGLALMIATAPATVTSSEAATSGIALAVFTYFLVTLLAAVFAAAIAGVRLLRNGRRQQPPTARERRSLAALPAMFWFNTVFVIVVALLMAPGLASHDKGTLAYGFFSGLLLAALLRVPGSLAEWWLTNRRLHRLVYAGHVGGGLLTGLGAVAVFTSPTPASPNVTADPVGSVLIIYLLVSSISTVVSVPAVAIVRAWLRRSASTALQAQVTVPPAVPTAPYSGLSTQTTPEAGNAQPRHRAAGPVGPLRTFPVAPEVPQPPTTPRAPTPVAPTLSPLAPMPRSAPASATAAQPPPSEPGNAGAGDGRATKLRHEIAVAVGIVAGLASLVQGFDSGDPWRTAVLALLVGGIGLAVIYGTTIRR